MFIYPSSISRVENYKAVNQLKVLSTNRFAEEILKEEKDSEDVNNEEQKPVITSVYANKKAIEISMRGLQEIQSKKNKNKEKMDDTASAVSDSTSVISKQLKIDNNLAQNVRLPFIIGTEDFNKVKTLGLTLFAVEEDEKTDKKEEEDNESQDSEVGDFIDNIPVKKKQREKWEKKEKKKKKKKIKKLFPDEITYILIDLEKKNNFKDGIKLIKLLNLDWKD